MAKNKTINVQGFDIVWYETNYNDYISLTDIARYKDAEHTDDIIKNWLRNRNTIELLGFWESIYNPNSSIVLRFLSQFFMMSSVCSASL